MVATLSKIGKRATPLAVLLALIAAADTLRSLTNSVDMTWPFSVLIVLAHLDTPK